MPLPFGCVCVFGKFKYTWLHTHLPSKLMYLSHVLFLHSPSSFSSCFKLDCVVALFLSYSAPHIPVTPLPSFQVFSHWESELRSLASWQLLFMSLSQRHTLSEGETPMLLDPLSTLKDPAWLEGRQRSGHSFTVHSTVLFTHQESNLTLVILGRHFSLLVCLGNTSCTS